MDINQTRKCPCCQKQIEGRLDSPKLRQGAKMGTKFAVKQGIKLVTGTSIPTATGAMGAAVGSVIPVVGTFLGYVAGYAVGYAAQDIALDTAYDKVEEKYATKKFFYYCPDCNLTWNSNETNEKNIVIRNFTDYYNMNKKNYPQKPRPFSYSKYEKAFDAIILCIIITGLAFLIPIFHKSDPDPYQAYKGELTYVEWVGIITPFIMVIVLIIVGISIYLLLEKQKCDKALREYYEEMEVVKKYNQSLYNDLITKLNNVINSCSPRLGGSVNSIPVNI